MYDDQTNAVYYFNYETQETVWTLPEDIDVHPIPLRFETIYLIFIKSN